MKWADLVAIHPAAQYCGRLSLIFKHCRCVRCNKPGDDLSCVSEGEDHRLAVMVGEEDEGTFAVGLSRRPRSRACERTTPRSGNNSKTIPGAIVGLIFGLMCGLICGLNRGGSTVIKHYALRLILWLNGYTPFKFVTFLDHCARLILLKKVGGGYIFIHRMLLEYFAELTPSPDIRNI